MTGLHRAGVVGCALVVGFPGPGHAQLPEAYRDAARATVLIEATWVITEEFRLWDWQRIRNPRAGPTGPRADATTTSTREIESNGSGFLIAPHGIVITNYHVLDPKHMEESWKRGGGGTERVRLTARRSKLTVRAFSGTAEETLRPGNVIRHDSANDLALMSVNFGRDMPFLTLADQLRVAK